MNSKRCERSFRTGTAAIMLCLTVFPMLVFSQWHRQYPAIAPTSVTDIVFVTKYTGFFSTFDGAIFKTTDRGTTWKESVRKERDFAMNLVFTDSLNGVGIFPHNYIGDELNILQTSNGGETWTERFIGPFNEFSFMSWERNVLFPVRQGLWMMSSYQGSIRRSTNLTDWSPVVQFDKYFPGDVGMPVAVTTEFVRNAPNNLLALSNKGEYQKNKHIKDSVSIILRSDSSGMVWDTLWVGADVPMVSITFSDEKNGWMAGVYGTIMRTTDGGTSWKRIYRDSSLTLSSIFAVDSLTVNAVAFRSGMLRSTDGGATWTKNPVVTNGLFPKVVFLNKDLGFFTGNSGYPVWTTDGGQKWNKETAGIGLNIFKVDFVTPTTGWALAEGKIFKTTDKGNSWNKQDSIPVTEVRSFDMLDTLTGWAGGDKKLCKTTDGGKSWTEKFSSEGLASFRSIQFFDGRLGAVAEARNLLNAAVNYITVDSGTTWTPYTMPEQVSSYPKVQFSDYRHGWLIEQNDVWCTNDTGKTWTKVSTDPLGAFSWNYDFIDSLRGWKTGFGVQYTTDGGITWKEGTKPYAEQMMDVKFVSPKQGFAVGYDGSIFSSSDGGKSWNSNPHHSRVIFTSLSSVKQGANAWVWAGGASFVVEYAPFIVDGVQRPGSVPDHFSLSQNYPNPFNPSTRIGFSLAQASRVSLKVYDALGRELQELANAGFEPGRYSIDWNAARFPSGVYFYRLSAGNFVQTKKMIFIK